MSETDQEGTGAEPDARRRTAMRFEDLVAWQRARAFARAVYAASATTRFDTDRSLRDQVRRSAVSVMANVAEGFERRSPRDFAKFITMAKASNAEVLSHLYIARDVRYLDEQQFLALRKESEEIGRILGALRAGLLRQAAAPRVRALGPTGAGD